MSVSSKSCDPEQELLTAIQAAKFLGLSRKSLWNHTAPRGAKIPCVRIEPGRLVRYSRSTLERWIAERERGHEG
jgi:predicted DNA-binding transcriptional regulator AlpA